MQFQSSKKQFDAILAGLRLLQTSLDNRLVLPNDGDIGDILTDTGSHEGMTAAEIDSFCEELNCGDPSMITLDLNVFDDQGNVVDGTTSDLSIARVSDIVDHAGQLILERRAGIEYSQALDELDEALVAAGIIRH